MIVSKINNNFHFNFLDEKHITNHNGIELKVRMNLLMGQVDGLPVSGNFWEAHSLMACISVNLHKEYHMYYTVTNKKASFFMNFIKNMVEDGFLLPRKC